MNDETEYTPQQRLVEVSKAIQAVLLGGQSYKLGSRSVTRADLALLKAMRDDLEAQLTSDDAPHLFRDTYVAFFDGR